MDRNFGKLQPCQLVARLPDPAPLHAPGAVSQVAAVRSGDPLTEEIDPQATAEQPRAPWRRPPCARGRSASGSTGCRQKGAPRARARRRHPPGASIRECSNRNFSPSFPPSLVLSSLPWGGGQISAHAARATLMRRHKERSDKLSRPGGIADISRFHNELSARTRPTRTCQRLATVRFADSNPNPRPTSKRTRRFLCGCEGGRSNKPEVLHLQKGHGTHALQNLSRFPRLRRVPHAMHVLHNWARVRIHVAGFTRASTILDHRMVLPDRPASNAM